MICPGCKKEIEYDLIPVSADPYSDFICYDCLPDGLKEAWDEFESCLKNSKETKQSSVTDARKAVKSCAQATNEN